MAQHTIEQAIRAAAQHHAAGRLPEAEAVYRQILAFQPSHPDAVHLLGVIAHQRGQHDVAVELIRRAISLRPNFVEAYSNLGVVLEALGQNEQAIAALRQAIALNPSHVKSYNNLGVSLRVIGQIDEAIAAQRQAIALNPGYASAYNNLGIALRARKQFVEAIAACRQAIALNPGSSKAYNNLGISLRDCDRLDEALEACRQAVQLDPTSAEAHSNLGTTLRETGKLHEAIGHYRQAMALNPTYANGRLNFAFALLANGEFEQGWDEHEWRWKCLDFPSPPRSFSQPLWDGQSLSNRTLLLHMEQGLGDALQFIRYLPLAAEQGGKIILECYPELRRLFEPFARGHELVVRGQPLPPFDFHCPLLSLPRVFKTTLDNIPHATPYLNADAGDVRKWRERLADSSSLKIGLAWAGGTTHKDDRARSMPLATLAPLAEAPGVQFYSLQVGPAAVQAKTPPAGLALHDFSADLQDFADTAALIENLDLVISVDTAVAHLAGALGKPVWTLLPFSADWRWLTQRDDSPWYPSMRLFRQSRRSNWEDVVHRVADALRRWRSYNP